MITGLPLKLLVCTICIVAPLRAAADLGSTLGQLSERVSIAIDDRFRVEMVDWFAPDVAGSPESYTFIANRLRVGASLTLPRLQIFVQVQDTRIGNLPGDAVVPPTGALGTGAVYFLHTRDRWQGETTLHQAYAVARLPRVSLKLGRFAYSDGAETTPGNATLAALKKMRIAQRMVGPFGFTHAGRSFDGGQAAWTGGAWNVTAIAARPTRGGFEVSANRELDRVTFASGTVTYTGSGLGIPSDLRLFYLYFDDRRRETTKTDNRTSIERSADKDAIAVHSFGGHALTEIEAGPGMIDGLFWFVIQTGDWGKLDHRAWSFALEGGYRFARTWARPWLRAGYNAASGDDDPGDRQHRTFLTPLPTARLYARFPFFNGMNLQDLFTQLILEPHPGLTARLDYHWLRLSEPADLWYAGGGATNEKIFGIAGLDSGGSRDLGHLVDLSLDYRWNKHLTISGYVGHTLGGRVVGANFSGRDATYGFIEMRLSL